MKRQPITHRWFEHSQETLDVPSGYEQTLNFSAHPYFSDFKLRSGASEFLKRVRCAFVVKDAALSVTASWSSDTQERSIHSDTHLISFSRPLQQWQGFFPSRLVSLIVSILLLSGEPDQKHWEWSLHCIAHWTLSKRVESGSWVLTPIGVWRFNSGGWWPLAKVAHMAWKVNGGARYFRFIGFSMHRTGFLHVWPTNSN